VSAARWSWLGRVPYADTTREQERLRAAVLAGTGPETFLFCEHDPVITLGRSARPANVLVSRAVLAARGVAVAESARGGDVTYHGPGQLVGYPVVRLRHGVLGHVTAMAHAVAAVLGELGIAALWRRDRPGLWVGDAKICAVGVHVRRGVAIHGFALNVSSGQTEGSAGGGVGAGGFDGFALIVPCGLAGARVTSIARELGGGAAVPPMHRLAARIARAFGAATDTTFVPAIVRAANDSFAQKIELSNGITRMIGA
jgi:lipoyl(octanoyl) transferase